MKSIKRFKVPSLSEIRDTASEHSKTSLVIIILLVVLLLLALQYIPHYQVAQFNITNQKDLADAENSYRATLAQIVGGVAIGATLYYTWRRISIVQEDLKITQENLKIVQEGQITERFTRAIEQLGAVDHFGNPVIEIRLGGIYALERISTESEKDYWPIMEILTAYIRENSACDEKCNLKVKRDTSQNEASSDTIKKVSSLDTTNGISLDIQAILTVIKRRNYSFTREPYGLDLRNAYLYKADLLEAHLEGANLINTNLSHADLRKAHLERINVQSILPLKATKTNLEGAHLEGAYLEGSNLTLANLKEAHLDEAHLKGADLSLDNLDGANLRGADLDEKLHIKLNEKYPHFAETGICK